MKKITLLILAMLFSSVAISQDIYKQIIIRDTSPTTLNKLAQQGIDLRCGVTMTNEGLILELEEDVLENLNKIGINYSVRIEDMTKFYSERAARDMPRALAELEIEKAKSRAKKASLSSNKLQRSKASKSSIANEVLANYLQDNNNPVEIDWGVPANFNLGSMGGCLTVSETLTELDDMHNLYPSLISAKQDASPTNETTYGNTFTNGGVYDTWSGQTVYYTRITGNQSSPEGSKPQILFTSMIHARESASLMQNIYFMWYLLENYSVDPAIKNLVDNNELYFIPIVNPDGLLWNEERNPNGGGGQRKNLRPGGTNNSDRRGVDVNRNFDYFWGADGEASGSSDVPTGTASQTYRGPNPFSEPESRILRDFVLQRSFKTCLMHHTAANGIPHPYGGRPTIASGREDEMHKWHEDMTKYNRYVSGATIFNPANGIADDWMLGGAPDGGNITPNTNNPFPADTSPASNGSGQNILASTPEHGHGSEGTGGTFGSFWPSPANFVPIAKRAVRINLMNIYYGGKYAKLHDLTQSDISTLTSNIQFGIERLGQTNSDFTLTLTPISSNIASLSSPNVQTGMTKLEQRNVIGSITLNAGIQPNDKIEYKAQLANDEGVIFYEANYEKYYQPNVFLADNPDMGSLANWTSSGGWTTTTATPFSGTRVIKDGNAVPYANNTNKTLTTANTYDFSNSNEVLVQFYTKWDLERNYDFVELLASTNGSTWIPVDGNYNKPNSIFNTNDANFFGNKNNTSHAFQNNNSSGKVYDGDQMDKYVMEEIVINASTNSFLLNQTNVSFRFRMRTDANNGIEIYNTTFTGFFIDDFKIIGLQIPCDNSVPPSNIAANNITSATANITWDAIPSASYDIRYKETSSGTWINISDYTDNSTILTGLTGSTNYEVQIRSRCTSATSSYSTSINFATTTPVPCSGSSVSSFPYSENFDTNEGLWTQPTDDDINWTRNSGGTPSNGTGPTSGDGDVFYMYTEASGNGTGYPSKEANFVSPCFDFTGKENIQFTYSYHLFGTDVGSLRLQVSLDNGTTYTTLDEYTANIGNTWNQNTVDLSIYQDQTIKLRFNATTGASQNGWSSDIAIDNINVTADISSFTPIASCQNINVTLDVNGDATIVAGDINDGSSNGKLSVDISSFTCANLGTNDVTLTATDPNNASNTDSCISTVTVTATKPADIVTNATICSGGTYNWAANGVDYTTTQSGTIITNDGCTANQVLNLTVTPQPAEPTTACYETATFNTTSCAWDVTGTQPAEPTTACYETATFNTTSCSWDVTGTQPAEPTTACYETATFNTTSCTWNVTGTQPAEPTTACYETATFNTTSCSWDVTGTQPAEPTTACYETATFNTTSCSWDVTGTQPAEPATACYETATFNTTSCAWDITGAQPAEPTTACYETATFNTTSCSWDVTGTQPAEPTTACYETATFNTTSCAWDITGTQPAEPTTACYETATFNATSCTWDVTGTQPAEPTTTCYETATFNTTSCSWDVTGTQPAEPTTACYETATFNTTSCAWDITGAQPTEPATACYETATFNTTSCAWDVTGAQPAEPTTACYETATFNTTSCAWNVTGTQPSEPTTACYETATFNTTSCTWDVTGTQPAEPTTTCYETATFNTTSCSWDVTGTQPAEPTTACYETATFNTTSCAWDVTGTQPTEPATACYETATFNTTSCAWDVTGAQPAEPTTACYETATFNTTSCAWNVTGTQPTEPATACYETATFNTTSCSWDVTGTQPAEPATACYETATFNTTSCAWDVTGTQPAEPATACYETATFNTTSCTWDVTGTQPAEPTTACYETATFNTTSCTWDVTGTQPAEPATACYETATFNTTSCSWDVTGTQPAEPATACYETATFNTTSCSWDVTGIPPAEPTTACYETATFNTTSCAWDVTGTQPAEPTTACYETATFNTTSCSWDVTGTQPAEPATACYETATFNTTSCSWDVTGTQPAEPATACYETATFNTTSCSWDVTGAQPAEPTTACYETATFNTTSCSWDVTGTQPAEPTTACYETATFNATSCSWDVTGIQPAEPTTACYETATFNTTSCSWDVTGTQPAEPTTACYETATFNTTSCSWDVTGTQPAEPATACYETATFNTTSCAWDVTGTQPAEPATACYETATFNTTSCSWDVTGTQPAEPATACYETATFNTTSCAWDVTGTQPTEPATACYETATFNTTSCAWDVTGTQPAEPATACYETATFNTTSCSWDVTGTQPAEPTTACYETATFNTTSCSWDITGTQPAEPTTACYETATFNTTSCSWDMTGTQPAEPTTACYETATFNTTSCAWDVTNNGSGSTYYIDSDNDGYGNPDISIIDCIMPTGYVANNSDCDDSNNTIYPGAPEVINDGIDQDCNGSDQTTLENDGDIKLANLILSPNPFNDSIIIKLPVGFNNSEFSIQVFDLNGRLVIDRIYSSMNSRIQVNGLNDLNQALYVFKIKNISTGITTYKRLIKD